MKAFLCATLALVMFNAAFGAVVINSMADIGKALKSKDIIVGDVFVPAGKTFQLYVQTGTKITFTGKMTFGYAEWEGPLIRIKGAKVTIVGQPGNLLDGDGKRWWDGKGGHFGKKKPKFVRFFLKDSTVTGLNVKNCPVGCVSLTSSNNVEVTNISVDVKEGDWIGATNTDGIDVGTSHFITIRNCVIYNQDDCFATGSGSNIIFENNFCSGGHGISIGSIGGHKDNEVSNVIMRNNKVVDSDNGVRIKTTLGTVGKVSNITFENIELSNIRKVGITVQGNYIHTGPRGEPTDGVPITGLNINNVWGKVLPGGTNILVWVKNAADWKWVSWVSGGENKLPCQGFPWGMTPQC